MADLESDIVGNATAPDEGCDERTVVYVLENEVISREVLKYLNLTDLKACTLVSQSLSYIAKCYIRDHFIIDANLPLKSSPCTALAALESAMDQMDIVHFTGLHIYVNACSAHPADSPLIQMTDDLYPNILNRLILNRLIVKFRASTQRMCWIATKLITTLLDKSSKTLKELSMDLTDGQGGRELLKLMHGGRVFTKLHKLTLKSCYFDEYNENDVLLRKAFYSSFPNLQEFSSQSLCYVPSEQFRFIKHRLVTGNNWWDEGHLRRMSEDNLKLRSLNVITTNLSRYNFGSWKERYGKEVEYLMHQSCDSLRTLIIQGQEFPQFSQLHISPMTNLRHLQIVYTMDDAWFLPELWNLCAMLPVLFSLHIYHSPCHAIHSAVEEFEDESEIVPNVSASILKLQGLDVEMDILMPILAKYFPNLRELQVYDCDSSALEYIFMWPKLECLALGGKTSFWNDNFDQVLTGFTEEEMHQWLDGANVKVNPTSLTTLNSLMRLYLTGGGQRSQEDSNVLLTSLAMLCLLKNLPSLAVRILPGYNGSVLSHLVTFDNADETLWCPRYPFDIEALFYP